MILPHAYYFRSLFGLAINPPFFIKQSGRLTAKTADAAGFTRECFTGAAAKPPLYETYLRMPSFSIMAR
jgi:hypothetical protein